jgi:Mg-chelatase subunit ChlD
MCTNIKHERADEQRNQKEKSNTKRRRRKEKNQTSNEEEKEKTHGILREQSLRAKWTLKNNNNNHPEDFHKETLKKKKFEANLCC